MPIIKNKGFTLIELLAVVGIIALLSTIILVAVSSSATKSHTASLRKTLDSLRAAVGVCCAGTANTILQAEGGNVCNPSTGSLLPKAVDLKAQTVIYGVSVGYQCANAIPTLNVSLTGHKNNSCNSTIYVRIDKVVLPYGCQ